MKSLQSDLALVAQVRLFQNKRAFDTLVQRYQSPIRRFFLHQTLGNAPLSDDLAQDTFLKAYTQLSTFQSLSGFSTWLYRIAYNTYYDYLRKQREQTGVESWEVDAAYQSEQPAVASHIDIHRGLCALKPDERTCISLFYIEDMPIERIAAVTHMPQGTVRSHLSRGRTKLVEFLKKNGYDKR